MVWFGVLCQTVRSLSIVAGLITVENQTGKEFTLQYSNPFRSQNVVEHFTNSLRLHIVLLYCSLTSNSANGPVSYSTDGPKRERTLFHPV